MVCAGTVVGGESGTPGRPRDVAAGAPRVPARGHSMRVCDLCVYPHPWGPPTLLRVSLDPR